VQTPKLHNFEVVFHRVNAAAVQSSQRGNVLVLLFNNHAERLTLDAFLGVGVGGRDLGRVKHNKVDATSSAKRQTVGATIGRNAEAERVMEASAHHDKPAEAGKGLGAVKGLTVRFGPFEVGLLNGCPLSIWLEPHRLENATGNEEASGLLNICEACSSHGMCVS